MTSTPTLAAALALWAAGPVVLRYGWQRNRPVVAGAWAILALAAVLLVRGEGAWGLAAGATCAMASAMVMLGMAAAVTPGAIVRTPRAAAERGGAPPGDLPLGGDLARRLTIFLVVVVLDLAASALLAWSVQRGLFRSGTGAADATALALFLLPLLWVAMASWQMMLDRTAAITAGMMAAPISAALLGGLLWLTT